jgi:hypothetical protein
MSQLATLKEHLMPGHVYRRQDLSQWSTSVDRHLQELVRDGDLSKVAPGIYYAPRTTVFGKVPADDRLLVETFLKDERFLMFSPNEYNKLGVGTTQLYNKTYVYNRKRHGDFRLGNRMFSFVRKNHYPAVLSSEFLLVDLVDHIERVAEDSQEVLRRVGKRAQGMPLNSMLENVRQYGGVKSKQFFLFLFRNES